ncbi:xanthine dehydrogenase/oxidase isoform X4 [Lepidochelys kempii]|uniref:xanthine dehydrogenase/oxidase isoform X4 n=1 Tax=Lepidochelys kempii TaxID=8472 RepID=UPI003C6EE74A
MASERTTDQLIFFVNGQKVLEKNVDPETTLLTYLRRKLGLPGTKLGCGEGGCGACTVMISKFDNSQKKIVHYSVNACLFPICALHRVAVTTVEGIGSTKTRLHPVQERIAKSHGSQCGFCTPGIVMSMYTLLRNRPQPNMEEIEENFQGNLCRCTGYRPILQGYRTFAKDWSCCGKGINGPGCCMAGKDGGCCGGKVNDTGCCMNEKEDNAAMVSSILFNPAEFHPLDPTQEPIFPPELLMQKDKPQEQLCFKGERVMWIQPTTLEELLALKAQYPKAKLVVGNTEVGIEMKLKNMLYPVIIAPAWIPEMTFVQHTEEGITFGAACTLSFVEVVLKKAVAELPSCKTELFRAVLEQLRWFAGPQIKNVAALGGNIMTASPISDLNPVFMACGSKLTLASKEGRRTIRMDENFFTGYRKTMLKPKEILLSIEMPYSRKEAIEKQSFYKSPKKIEKGDVQNGFEESDHVVEGEMYIGGQEHFYLETHCTIAVPKGEDGEMELFVSTQNPMKTQECVANALGVPANRILVRVKRLGGGFGGKESRNILLSTAVAVAAFKTGHPVRCMLDRDEDMLITGGRHPFLGCYKVGFMKNGKINSLEVSYYSNGGNSEDLSLAVMDRALFHMDNSYNIPNIKGVGTVCKTNLSSNTAFRGFGGPQGMMVVECWMSDVILTCGLPAEQVRKLNLYNEGDLTHFNQKLEEFTLRRCWEECLVNSKYEARRKLIDEFNRQNRWKKRGIAIIPTKFGISFTLSFLNQAGALVHVYTDGSVLLTHGGTEMGQGLHTKMIQVASRTLGIPTTSIHLSETSTNTVPNTSATAASVSTDLNGMAVLRACETILERLKPFKHSNPKGSWKDWVGAAYINCVSLSATGFYRIPDLSYDYEKNEGNPFNYFSYGVACSEVEIDCLTGDHKNLRTDIVMDVGTSLNPAIDIGQIEGGFIQGLGLFTLEELRYSPEGDLYTRGPGMYKIPAFGDIPTEFYVSLLRDCPNSKAIYSSKAVGEPPLFLSASVFYAIKDAIFAARAESGLKGPFRLDSPATPERIRNACIDMFTKLCPSAKPGTFKPWSVRV